jgi:hypothetical protein
MGDTADMAVSETFDMDEYRSAYRAGKIPQQLAYDLGIVDEQGNELRARSATYKTCKYCGTHGFVWKQDKYTGWRLAHPNGQLHMCAKFYERRAQVSIS